MVTKQVADFGDYFKEKDVDYTFRVMKVTNATGAKEIALVGETFEIYENGQKTDKTGTVEADGTFKLKDGQSALFREMIEATEVLGGYQYHVEEFQIMGSIVCKSITLKCTYIFSSCFK